MIVSPPSAAVGPSCPHVGCPEGAVYCGGGVSVVVAGHRAYQMGAGRSDGVRWSQMGPDGARWGQLECQMGSDEVRWDQMGSQAIAPISVFRSGKYMMSPGHGVRGEVAGNYIRPEPYCSPTGSSPIVALQAVALQVVALQAVAL